MSAAQPISEVTFRDFAGAVMGDDAPRAAEVLTALLALSAPSANAAVAHFRAQMSSPSFMSKAMSLRTAVTGGSTAETTALLGDCFGLTGDDLSRAVTELRRRYPG
ncbi:MAG: hypothetical protein NVS3B20_16710 [Polyangiales bacterium]